LCFWVWFELHQIHPSWSKVPHALVFANGQEVSGLYFKISCSHREREGEKIKLKKYYLNEITLLTPEANK
jgi:hypothetical protein